MYLSDSQIQFLLANIRLVTTVPIYVYDANWQKICSTAADSDWIGQIRSACAEGQALWDIEQKFSVEIHPYRRGETIDGYLLFERGNGTHTPLSYIFTLLDLLQSNPDTYANRTLNMRTQLATQLAFYGKENWEVLSCIKQLQYSFAVPRCAVLFHLETLPLMSPLNLQTAFSMLLSTSAAFSKEDIWGPIGEDIFLVFKHVQDPTQKKQISSAKQYAEKAIVLLRSTYRVEASAYVGSPYVQLSQLQQSFQEAQFLLNNAKFFNPEAKPCITILQYLLPYLVHQLPDTYQDLLFQDFDLALGNSQFNIGTLAAISENSCNLSKAAEALQIHRNTLHHRFSHLQDILAIKPLRNDRDRLFMNSYTFHKTQTSTWHACINIQPWSVQHLGLKKFSEILSQRSSGALRIDVERISTAGDYRSLIESVCSGQVDCVSVSTTCLFDMMRGWPHILEIPFLFSSSREAYFLLNNYVRQELQRPLLAMGAVLMGFWSMGWRYITSDTPVRTPADMRGKRIRILPQSSFVQQYFTDMGASVIQAHYSDIPISMFTGAINCQENPYSNILGMEFYRYQKYVTQMDAVFDVNAILVSKTAWERLPQKLQQTAEDTFQETLEWIFKESYRVNVQARQKLLDKGMELIIPDEAEINLWKEAAAPIYRTVQNHSFYKGLIQEKERYHAE